MKYPHIVVRDGVWYPAGTEVPVGEPMKVELTDNVPDGALDEHPDGSIKAYDEAGNKVGTVSAEEVEQLQREAGEMLPEQSESVAKEPKQANRGRKPKEA